MVKNKYINKIKKKIKKIKKLRGHIPKIFDFFFGDNEQDEINIEITRGEK